MHNVALRMHVIINLSSQQLAVGMHVVQAAVIEEEMLCRAQAELDGIQEEQTHMGELGVGMSPLQAADLDCRKEKVAKLVKVRHASPNQGSAASWHHGSACC